MSEEMNTTTPCKAITLRLIIRPMFSVPQKQELGEVYVSYWTEPIHEEMGWWYGKHAKEKLDLSLAAGSSILKSLFHKKPV